MRKSVVLLFAPVAVASLACSGGSGTATRAPNATAASVAPAASASTVASAAASVAASDLDRAFIDMMVPHHQAAIEEAKIAQQRAQHDELKSMADDIISSQQAEIDKMKEWRADWFGSADTPPISAMPMLPGMAMPGASSMPGMSGMPGMSNAPGASPASSPMTMDMTTDIDMLKTAEPFDEAFMKSMISHHEMAIEAAQLIVAETQVPAVRDLARSIISAQQAEIDQMQEWLAAWYPQAS